MNDFISANAVALLILAFSVLWLIVSACWSWWVESPPLDQTISLSPPGTLETAVTVRIGDQYWLWLNFERGGLSLDALREKTGGMTTGPDGKTVENAGTPVTVRWQMTAKGGGEPVFAGEVRSTGAASAADATIGRLLGRAEVRSGRYSFTAEIVGDTPEFAGAQTRLTLVLDEAKGHSWALKLGWLLSLLGSFAIKPVAVVAAAVVAWNAARLFM